MSRLASSRSTVFVSLALAATGLLVFGGCDERETGDKSESENTSVKASDAHKHDGDDHSGHSHGPDGECSLDAEKAVGVEEAEAEAAPEVKPVGG